MGIREEDIRRTGRNHRDKRGFLTSQHARSCSRLIFKGMDGGQNPVPCSGSNFTFVVDNTRHGLVRDTSLFGYLLDRYPSRHKSAPLLRIHVKILVKFTVPFYRNL